MQMGLTSAGGASRSSAGSFRSESKARRASISQTRRAHQSRVATAHRSLPSKNPTGNCVRASRAAKLEVATVRSRSLDRPSLPATSRRSWREPGQGCSPKPPWGCVDGPPGAGKRLLATVVRPPWRDPRRGLEHAPRETTRAGPWGVCSGTGPPPPRSVAPPARPRVHRRLKLAQTEDWRGRPVALVLR